MAACGWLLACDALALSLGRARGVALIGRPLDLAVQAADAGLENPCANADVFYGDTRVNTGVSVRWEPAADGQHVLRVRSDTPVDEPVVTLYLSAGCGNAASTRRYVLLSEPLPELAPATPVPAREAAPRLAPASRPAAPRTQARRQNAQAKPRLRLEPLDLSVDRDPVLRLTSELGAPPAADPQRRTEAAAWWQALQRAPEQAVQEALRLQGAERELKAARDEMQRNAVAVGQLRGEVEQAGRGRSTASFAIVALALALFALMAWLAWRWLRDTRVSHVRHWFEANSELAQPPMPIVDAAAARRMTAPAPPQAPARAAPAVPASPPAEPAESIAGWAAPEAFHASRGGTVRMVGVGELIDLHDKADFFLSIGEHEQAIAALEAHVHDHVETSALAWMDLLELYHRFGKRMEFERLRAEFERRFTVQVPDFEHFDQPTATLESYSRALSRIMALWPSRRVLDVIEESIFRQPGLPGAEPFSLDAYRDLVLLYHLAQDMARDEEAAASPDGPVTDFHATSLQPLQAFDRPAGGGSAIDPLLVPPSSPRLGVDIELEAEAPASELPLDFDISGYEPPGRPEPLERRKADS
ncbi:MAG: hypothetical protein EOO30_12010 [Comamonadaceae bacterium]|nr:MAG: hypothetical protein EOO30_12010 [Comamonadaceae bacterium]